MPSDMCHEFSFLKADCEAKLVTGVSKAIDKSLHSLFSVCHQSSIVINNNYNNINSNNNDINDDNIR